ncbi:murein hydrolase activator EnvC family protein [Selenomonas sp. KH1T6]|uniref:murein hydrolase activator EnvC family protein n=1 Tax=Selenomonas sp. KH1T6 TaxID=3158784 RepID=UPI0008A8033F|nr:Murein DD-endopeptidase MepM and murein hydrolase activator NlpD, contain LysM domain [Selenomonas ruminantium]
MEKMKIRSGAWLLTGLMAVQSATALASLEDDKASYDAQAEEKRQQSEELAGKIESLSEEKRILDEEAEAAIAEHEACKAELDATEARLEENEEKLKKTQADYEDKTEKLGKRVRDIYINGQISYMDVLFGAKDFSDLMTRMDLLKRVIKQDYDLVQLVLAEKADIERTKSSLEKDKAVQVQQEEKARAARDEREIKVAKRKALLDRMKNDKAVIDAQYDELMAASKQVEEMLRRSSYASAAPAAVGGGSGAMLWPMAGPVTSEFGWRVHPITGTQKFHSGVDIGGDYGQPIAAAQGGTVEYAGWISGYGNAVIISHGGGISTLYGHCQSLAVGVGQQVSRGETVAYCGSTGNSTGPHCHFEVRQGGEPISPYSFL